MKLLDLIPRLSINLQKLKVFDRLLEKLGGLICLSHQVSKIVGKMLGKSWTNSNVFGKISDKCWWGNNATWESRNSIIPTGQIEIASSLLHSSYGR